MAKLVPHLACNVGVLSDRASAQLPKKPSNLLRLRLTVDKMILNLKTAKALDLAVPPSILLRATEVIE
jgi:hypothetical protein